MFLNLKAQIAKLTFLYLWMTDTCLSITLFGWWKLQRIDWAVFRLQIHYYHYSKVWEIRIDVCDWSYTWSGFKLQ